MIASEDLQEEFVAPLKQKPKQETNPEQEKVNLNNNKKISLGFYQNKREQHFKSRNNNKQNKKNFRRKNKYNKYVESTTNSIV